jgi:Dolichyl-phosphate-mannose-protein mannosyltransferase
VSAVRARAAAAPAWLWLAGIVVLSAVIRIALARRMVAPWIMIDEIVYSELAKSFAAHGTFLVRGVASHGYGFVYPVVIAPAYRLFSAVPDAYVAVKAINSVVMSLAAVPAYFLARRLLTPRPALVVAALTVAVPSMLYTGTIMTENVFYPLFLVVALALVLMLERPTARRQVGLLVLCLVAYLTRQQAVALAAAAATAPVLLALVNRQPPRRFLRTYAPLYGIFTGGVVLALLDTIARGRSIYSLLGAYRAATNESYTVGSVAHYLLWHVAELDLYLGVIPFAALLAIWFAPRAGSPAVRAFAAGSFAIAFWLVLEVATFASQQSQRIEERNMFYVAPLGLVALLGLASEGVVPRRRRALLLAAAIAAVLPAFIPFPRFIGPPAVSDTFALLPWWWIQDHWIHLEHLKWAALAGGIAAAALFLWVPRRLALVLPALVGAYFVFTSFIVDNGRHGIHVDSVGSLWAGIRKQHPDWIDRAVGHNASVDYLWTGVASDYSIWENEFFNRSFRRVYNLAGNPESDPLTETFVSRGPGGTVLAAGKPVSASYLLTDGSAAVVGHPVASDPRIGVTLYRVDGPIVLLTAVHGVYPDTWAGKRVTYLRRRCSGGRLTVTLGSDPALFSTDQVVTASEYGAAAGQARVPPSANAQQPVSLTIPLASRGGACSVVFTVQRTKVPGPKDMRSLGAHFLGFAYKP